MSAGFPKNKMSFTKYVNINMGNMGSPWRFDSQILIRQYCGDNSGAILVITFRKEIDYSDKHCSSGMNTCDHIHNMYIELYIHYTS